MNLPSVAHSLSFEVLSYSKIAARGVGTPKSGRTQSLLTGSKVRGDALKDCSEGNWRSGMRRSGDLAAGAQSTFSRLLYVPICY